VQLKVLEDNLAPLIASLDSELNAIDATIVDDKAVVHTEYSPLISAKEEEIRIKQIEIGEVK